MVIRPSSRKDTSFLVEAERQTENRFTGRTYVDVLAMAWFPKEP